MHRQTHILLLFLFRYAKDLEDGGAPWLEEHDDIIEVRIKDMDNI